MKKANETVYIFLATVEYCQGSFKLLLCRAISGG